MKIEYRYSPVPTSAAATPRSAKRPITAASFAGVTERR